MTGRRINHLRFPKRLSRAQRKAARAAKNRRMDAAWARSLSGGYCTQAERDAAQAAIRRILG